ncbi:MAG TPA: cobalamin-independent methionine synthase II family protein [Solirubrobacteraceae bacterium]|nr:cobalamin-independent methionine synthase II family protein [Solirubrobacteraceae bacterium]
MELANRGPTIYRAEVVGSMLRPPELVAARAEMRAGELAMDRYRAVEDRAVDEALRIQEEAGVDVATDGEMRRDIFFDFFVSGMTGLEMVGGQTVRFHGRDEAAEMEVEVPFSVTGKVNARTCPGVAELQYAQPRSRLPVKVTVPSPMLLALGFWNERSRAAYPDPLELAHDGVTAVRGWIAELIEAGCKYVQIDAPDLAEAYADAGVRDIFERDSGIPAEQFLPAAAELIAGLGDIERPDDVTLGLHVCKGNGTQSWLAEGGYNALARAVFPRVGGFDVVHMEYDDDRSGGFEPLRELPDHVTAALGLVSTKWTELEDADALRRRIEDAARFHPLERLAIGPQCGFASASETAVQRKVTAQTQIDKLRLVAEVARSVWG